MDSMGVGLHGAGNTLYARGVYLIQDTSNMGTVRVKQEEETDTRIMRESSKKSGRKEREHEREKS